MAVVISGTSGVSVPAGAAGDKVPQAQEIPAAVKAALSAAGDAPVYGCRAWVNFDGTKDSTGAASTANTARFIRASGNVSSVMRNGAGDYTVNFTTALPDVNYAVSVTGALGGGSGDANFLSGLSRAVTPPTAVGSVRIVTGALAAGPAANPTDAPTACVAVFR